MKKPVLIGAVAVVFVIITVVCILLLPNNNNTQPSAQSFVYDGSNVEITLCISTNRQLLESAVAEFNKTYPNITINIMNVGDTFYYVKTRLSAGNNNLNIVIGRPDEINAIDNTGQSFLLCLDGYIECQDSTTNGEICGLSDYHKENYIESLYERGSNYGDNKTYSLPLFYSYPLNFFYDKEYFDNHKLDLPKTWEDLDKLVNKIKEIDPHRSIIDINNSSVPLFLTIATQMNSPYISDERYDFDNETNKSILKMLGNWDAMSTKPDDVDVYDWNYSPVIHITNYMTAQQYCVAPMPQYDLNNPKSFACDTCLYILDSKNEQKNAASWLFAKFLSTSEYYQSQLVTTTKYYMPVIKSVADSSIVKESINNDTLHALIMREMLKNQNTVQITPVANKGYDVLWNFIEDCFYRCAHRHLTDPENVDAIIDDIFKEAMKEANRE